jgi:hypothetical protein
LKEFLSSVCFPDVLTGLLLCLVFKVSGV